MNFIDLPQMISACGSVALPGSKSISNRALLLAALAEGTTELRALLDSDDTARMREALATLGITLSAAGENEESLRVAGCGGQFPVRQAELFLGNAGTAFRSLTAVLAFTGGTYTLKGVPRMHERPIGDLVDALMACGANIEYLEKQGFPPLSIRPAVIRPGSVVKIRGDVSSQFLSGLLLALPLAGAGVTVEVEGELISRPYVDMTLNLMARFGVSVEREGWQTFSVPAGARYRSPGIYRVEGDASSASYFLALGAIGARAENPVRVSGVGKNAIQGDVRFADALAAMGATIEMGDDWISAARPQGDKPLVGLHLDCNPIPDAAMTLAVVALFAKGETTLANIASWRVKETDRIAAMASELRKLNVRVEEGADFLKIIPPDAEHPLQPAAIETYDDHRVAMCFSLASFGVPLRICDPGCVAKTFPDYFERFLSVARPAPVIAIDGPTASGKGVVSARVAAALGFHYLDSGALYRLTALAARDAGVDWADEAGVASIAARLDVVFHADGVRLNGREAGTQIRDEAISSGASKVAALPAVREALLFRQRAFHRAPGLVGDGRDMGSVVFSDAGLKVFLTASPVVRAERRTRQLRERNDPADFSAILADLEARDARDRARPIAPLKQEADALLLDTDSLSIDEAVAKVLEWFAARHGYTEEKAAPPVPPAPPSEPQAAGMPPSKMADSNKSSAPIKGADADSVVHSESAGLLDYLGFPNSRRMKRRTFWIACSLWGVVTFVTFCFFLILSIVLRIVLREPLMWVPICIYFVALIRFSILRCRDVGWEPWLVWFFSILLPITLFLFNISDNVVMNRDAESAVQVLTIIILGACGIFFLLLSLCPSKKYAPMDMTEEKTIAPPIPLLPLSETADSVRSPAPATGADAGFVNNHVSLRDYLGFPPSGRMNRLTFLIACGLWGGATYIAFYVFFILAILMTWNAIMTVLVPVFIYFVVLVRFSILRCRDAGCTTWLVWFFSALPLATISALILLILLGEAGWHNAIFLICMIPVLSVWCVFSLCLSLWPSKTETGAQWGSAKLFLVNVVFILTWLFFLMWL